MTLAGACGTSEFEVDLVVAAPGLHVHLALSARIVPVSPDPCAITADRGLIMMHSWTKGNAAGPAMLAYGTLVCTEGDGGWQDGTRTAWARLGDRGVGKGCSGMDGWARFQATTLMMTHQSVSMDRNPESPHSGPTLVGMQRGRTVSCQDTKLMMTL
jgi:hypothetical protein